MVACSLAAVWQCRRLKLRPLPSPPFPAHPLLPLPLLLLLAALALPPRKVPQQAAWMVAKITCMGQVGTGLAALCAVRFTLSMAQTLTAWNGGII